MLEIRQSPNNGNLILLVAGIVCLVCGAVMISDYATFASWFLGAKLSSGVPLSEVERLKVLFVEFGGMLTIAEGIVLLVVGLVRSRAPQNTMAKPIGR